MTDKLTILRQIKNVPSLPSVVIKIRKYLNNPDVSFDKLARAIEHDPGLTANILQLANSAYFGWSRKIKTVKEAVTRLGTNHLMSPSPGKGAYYTNTMHNLMGNVALGDGSVQQFSSGKLKDALRNSGDSRNQLAFPGDRPS